ncbi:hypothetical protein M2140_001778 [Clostridiales Family XIII bacterium PM5-7]
MKKKLVTMMLMAALIVTSAVPIFATTDTAPIDPTVPDVTDPIDPTEPEKPLPATKKPTKVTGVKVSKNGYRSLKVTWTEVPTATKYQIYRATKKTGKYVLKKTTTATTYSNVGLTSGKTYYYKVRAVNAKGKGAFSAIKSNKVQPATVKNLSVPLGGKDSEPYSHTPQPTWSKVTGATGYQVYRTIEGKNTWKKVATTTKTYWRDAIKTGFRSYENYEYKVRAYRTVKGKKVYGYFSAKNKYTPDWNMNELMPELIAYGESVEGQRLQYNGTPGDFSPYTGVRGPTYTMKHIIGSIENPTTETGWEDVLWGDAEAKLNPTYEEYTPENSSWTALFPADIKHYWKKETVLKRCKGMIASAIKSEMNANPMIWEPGDPEDDYWWTGTDWFIIYTRKTDNGYRFWVMF